MNEVFHLIRTSCRAFTTLPELAMDVLEDVRPPLAVFVLLEAMSFSPWPPCCWMLSPNV